MTNRCEATPDVVDRKNGELKYALRPFTAGNSTDVRDQRALRCPLVPRDRVQAACGNDLVAVTTSLRSQLVVIGASKVMMVVHVLKN